MERPTSAKPITEPARKAVLKASVQALGPAAITVVRALEYTATFMPIKPETIEVTPPACDYWNLQLGNIWAESLDYHTRPTHVNSGQAAYEDDGSVRIIVAHENPGQGNWLDTAGHHHGTMGVRWVRAQEHPQPATRVVKLADLL